MPKAQKPPKPKPQQLLVEGKNDQHVIWALCEKYRVPETFSVEVPTDENGQGIEVLLEGLSDRLKAENLRTLGIVVDADRDLLARWQSLRYKLSTSGYQDIPETPPPEGWVYAPPDLPKVGVWLMPNNQLPGMLEDFVAHLIPSDDILCPKADGILQEIEQAGINCYSLVHHPKALIHTWLAWQETPGMPMGQAITARVLRHESAIAIAFLEWLKDLFNPALPTS
ncbi:hypothetical protein H6S82_02315 [Planktothrix sp. FACHB-1355]|uniref:Uncharacterized protein n=1 Tax=Aerosakkonema funiforme FACHB-1375 TaxID=2949571 RepID=A0A926VCP0_9CYAN|nr:MULTISPECIES: DUF3226 domain-containing protein [Oscillatoriales]MBD2181426.1 hypothetical protein [Aerosakkonema funiforme FACHB-1375]MBD3557691.1 hypothetical protein [Planktothrix sp. FACHB-1355]